MNLKILSKLLQKAKELNILRRNCMKTKQELEKAIAETQLKYKGITFGNESRIREGCLNELFFYINIYNKTKLLYNLRNKQKEKNNSIKQRLNFTQHSH